MGTRRVVVTGMGINTTLGDDLDTFYRNLVEGRSGITHWRFFEDDRVYSRIGGDLSGWDAAARLEALRDQLPGERQPGPAKRRRRDPPPRPRPLRTRPRSRPAWTA